MNLLKIILLPLVPVYAAVINLRNWLFDKKIFKSEKVNAKVISIGNITVGGSGKTPAVIYLLELLKNERIKAGVLSRGYGRKSKGYLLVSDGNKILASVDKCGDEIYQTVTECKVPGAVSERRAGGAKKFLSDVSIDVIVLDDAFQHRWIERDIDIVICEQRFLISSQFLNISLLPVGKLRESFGSLKRADAIIINRKFSEPAEIPFNLKKYFENKKIFTAHYQAEGFVDIMRNTQYKIEDFKDQKSLVVAGIANPFSLFNALRQTSVNTQNQLVFRDHKNYALKEVQRIRRKFYATNSHSVVTTQKDAVKLAKFSKELDDIDIFYLKIKLKIDEPNSFKDFIINKLNLKGYEKNQNHRL